MAPPQPAWPREPQRRQTPASKWTEKGTNKEIIAYGERSRFVTSLRAPVAERDSPDAFGLMFHVLTPLQDSVGSITPSSLHYVATHRGSFVPEIDPKEHRLMIHGMVDRPLIFTVDELKRLPYVTRVHFLECIGNRSKPTHKTVQETHGMTSCSEWTGVLLSVLLKEAGVQSGASWIVAEGAEEIKGASSVPLGKAMDDCLVCYGQNGEAVRPQQGFPLRLIVPGFEGIFQTKYLRRIKVVDRYYMTYNDYGHINPDPKVSALGNQIGPKSVITYPSGGQKLSGPGFYEISGLAWSGGRRNSQSGNLHRRRQELERRRAAHAAVSHGAYPLRSPLEVGRKRMRYSYRAAPTNSAPSNPPAPSPPNSSTSPWTKISASPAPTTPFKPGASPAMGAFTMVSHKLLPLVLALSGSVALRAIAHL